MSGVGAEGNADAALLLSASDCFPPDTSSVAVAVSGGGDSLALLLLLARVANARRLRLHAVTVDHRLRPESAAEAAFVGVVCARLGIAHDVLVWDHGEVRGNLADQARAARYRLMGDWARARGLAGIALGHTADDQAEGFLMALFRESGLDGLSGMVPLWGDGGLLWARPLLAHTRKDLRDWLTRQGERWIDDPSNDDQRYLRVRARRAVEGLSAMNITPQKIARSVGFLQQSRGAIESGMAGFAQAHVSEAAGALNIDRAAFDQLHIELQRRFLVAAVRWIGRLRYPPRRSTQMQALSMLQAGRSSTLGGARLRVGPSTIRVAREPRAVAGPVPLGHVWDGRWVVQGPAGGEVRALGVAGLAQIPDWRRSGMARDALVVSPGIWVGARLIAAPCLGFGAGYKAKLEPDFATFLLSH